MLEMIGIAIPAALFGMGYMFFATLIGSKISGIIWRESFSDNADIRIMTSLFFGVLLHVALSGAAIALFPSALAWTFWALLLCVVLDWKNTFGFLKEARRPILICSAFGLACFTILLAFHYGAARGDTLFWTAYNLTGVSPGDSPQGLFQAQYLIHGASLANMQDFAIFDRPFLGGIVTAAALSAIGLMPSQSFGEYSPTESLAYFALWIWINSSIVYAVLAIAKRYALGIAGCVICGIALAAPSIVFNTIGVWPKLFGVYIILCASLLIFRRQWWLAAFVSGVSFLVHGSFLWAHLSLIGVLIIYILFWPSNSTNRYINASAIALIGFAFPAFWFGADHFFGGQSPLQAYYIYGVSTDYGLHHSLEDMAQGFYSSTSPQNLLILPFINLIKGLLPFETLGWLVSSSYSGPILDWRSFAEALFRTQFTRFLFPFCLTGGVIALIGIKRNVSKNWHLSLALIVFVVLPLIPGMTLYRRDDHFIAPIMLFALIPIIIATALTLNKMTKNSMVIFASLIFTEYAVVYASRYPSVRYIDNNFEHYLWLTLVLLGAVYASTMIRVLSSTYAAHKLTQNKRYEADHA
ncbi:hypothetical protein ACQR3P_30485 [Rhodococcus sp. IEGM1300]